MLHTIYRMSLGEIISTSGTFVFTSFLSQAKNRSEFIDDEFILEPRKELYWPVAQHLLTLCNRAWARMCVCMCVCESVSVRYFLVPKASRLPPSANHAMNERSRCHRREQWIRWMQVHRVHVHVGPIHQQNFGRRREGESSIVSLQPQETRDSKKGETVLELSLNPPESWSRNDIQPKVSTSRASVVNLPRSSFGSGEIIVRSRNSKRRPGRPLPKDYINAVSVSRRLRIGRCSLFPCRFEQTCGMPRGFSRLENVKKKTIASRRTEFSCSASEKMERGEGFR